MRKVIRVVGRIVIGLAVFVVLVAVVGIVYQAAATRNDQREISLPGEMVDIGGYHIHIKVMGEGNLGPTVVLENGGSGIVPQWGRIQPEIAKFAQVVAYDRPGTGWSEAPPEPLDAAGSAQALHQTLETLGMDGPYVLVGHSMGGLMARVFATLYPEDVAGMVLVDPRDVTWEGVFTEEESRVPIEIYRLLGVLSHFGVTRITGFAASQAEGLPEESYQQAVAIGSTPKYMNGVLDDYRYGETAIDFLKEGEDLQDVPMIVLSAGAPDQSFNASQREGFIALHTAMADLSPQGHHRIVPGAGHFSIIMDPEYAAVVVEAVHEMINQAGIQAGSR